MKATLVECVNQAGELLLRHFGKIDRTTRKSTFSDVVTDADFASEKLITKIIRTRHRDHNLLGEEGGIQSHGSDITWVIDPLDGTSNFAAGLPWFGVMIAVLQQHRPVMAAMYLPVTDTLYLCERGGGVLRNGRPVKLSKELELANVLCASGLDAGAPAAKLNKQARLIKLLVTHARNLRLTNSLVDLCGTLDGQFGACVNHSCKIWDIAPSCLMFPEAGACFTDLQGQEIKLDLHQKSLMHNYAILGAKPALHKQVLRLAREAGL